MFKFKFDFNSKLKINDEKIRVFEGFAGYGGASFALKRLYMKYGFKYKIIGYSEINDSAIDLYNYNHKDIVNFGDIQKIDPKTLPDFDLFTGGFPCQPWSNAGLGLGELDNLGRGTLFYDIIRIISEKKPRMILLENVKGILSKKHSDSFTKIIESLKDLGYNVNYHLFNSCDYGNAQNRERVFIYGNINENIDISKITFTDTQNAESNHVNHVKNYLDEDCDQSLYLTKQQISRLIELHGVDFNVKEPLCLDVYNKKIKYNGLCPTLTEPHHNSLRLVEPPINGEYRVRKLSVKEHFRLMGFKDNEILFPDNLSYNKLCERAGNGWDINLVQYIFCKIFNLNEVTEVTEVQIINNHIHGMSSDLAKVKKQNQHVIL